MENLDIFLKSGACIKAKYYEADGDDIFDSLFTIGKDKKGETIGFDNCVILKSEIVAYSWDEK